MATFLLLVLRPLIAVATPVSSSLPNRERMISSMGLSAAAQGFFANVVPANLRSGEAVDLLVDLVTQHILAAANDEKHLLTLVADMRNIDDAGIAKLLAIDDYDDGNGSDQLGTGHFDVYSVPQYRKELERRLNRISGGKLHITRSQYPLHALWKRVMSFCSHCASSWRVPSILGDVPGKQADISFNALTSADEADEYGDITAENERDILVDDEQEAEHQTTDDPAAMEEEVEPTTNGPSTNVAPIDPSFREERRVATLLRDVQEDAYLEELMGAIDAEHIDISDLQVQSRTPRRVRPAYRHVFAQVPSHPADNGYSSDDRPAFRMDVDEEGVVSYNGSEFQLDADERARASDGGSAFRLGAGEGAGVSDDGSEFRLDAEDDEEASVPDSPREQVTSGRGRSTNLPRRLGKRRVDSDNSSGSDLNEEELRMARNIVNTIRVPPNRSRQTGDLRGRRGIAAEDMSDLVAARKGRVEFTPSASNSPASANGRRGNAGGSERDARSAEYETLGQYRPLKLVRSKPTHGGSSRHGHASDHSDYSDAGRGTASRREKPVQSRVRWSEEEEMCLVRALTEFGPFWALILQHHGEGGSRSQVLHRRTGRNLKDKARNIKLRLMRENKPLGPFARVTGS
ncbi:TTAGGG repeat binding factor [Coemansia linderi]|uniref:TTAGGG repeat binding factor n=1 Tax=Coemansia linderi TaxID=2663919 RepID=A0ACC1KDT1_9FUNG|nr:TTAGGG repeat binding factor [Coemansia linderi]